MATGTGERPLGTPAQEKALLGINTLNSVSVTMSANTTNYIRLLGKSSDYYRQGIIITGGLDTTKAGVYIYNRTNNTNLNIANVKQPTQTGLSVTKGGNDYITVTNGTSALHLTVISLMGPKPEITSTQPT